MTKKDYDEIFTKLLELFPNPDTELNYQTPFQLLVAVMLSAQTTDRQVNVVTDKLFLEIKEPNDIPVKRHQTLSLNYLVSNFNGLLNAKNYKYVKSLRLPLRDLRP